MELDKIAMTDELAEAETETKAALLVAKAANLAYRVAAERETEIRNKIALDMPAFDSRVFRRSEIDGEDRDGWVADLNTTALVSPDCYWRFDTNREAREFLALVDGGMDPLQAAGKVTGFFC